MKSKVKTAVFWAIGISTALPWTVGAIAILKYILRMLGVLVLLSLVALPQTTINFEACPQDPKPIAAYAGVDWSGGPWDCELAAVAGNATQTLSWRLAVNTGSFKFAQPTILQTFRLGAAGTLVIKTDAGETFTIKTLDKTWTKYSTAFKKPASVYTVTFSGSWSLELDDFVLTTTPPVPTFLRDTGQLLATVKSETLWPVVTLTASVAQGVPSTNLAARDALIRDTVAAMLKDGLVTPETNDDGTDMAGFAVTVAHSFDNYSSIRLTSPLVQLVSQSILLRTNNGVVDWPKVQEDVATLVDGAYAANLVSPPTASDSLKSFLYDFAQAYAVFAAK